MRKNEMTTIETLLEAVGIVAALIDIGLQIYYGFAYGANAGKIMTNIATLLLIYVGLTLLAVYPEKVNGLTKEACAGKIRTYTIRMVRIMKLVFVGEILFTSICDVMGHEINAGYSLVVVVLIVGTAFVYESKIIRILRENHRK